MIELDIQRIQPKQITLKTDIWIKREISKNIIKNTQKNHYQIRFLGLKTYYPFQVIDLRFQIDYLTPKRTRLFEEYETAPEHTNLHFILIKHKEIKVVSKGNKTTTIELISDITIWISNPINDNTEIKRFYEEPFFRK